MALVYKKLTRRKWLWILVGALGAVAVILLTILLSIPIRSDTLKDRVIALLSDQLESEVTIERLEGRVFPRVSVSGGGVVIRQKGRTDVPPLITIAQFEIRGSLRDLMRHPRKVERSGCKVSRSRFRRATMTITKTTNRRPRNGHTPGSSNR